MPMIGIYNENDFYSSHYLSSLFESDIRGVLEWWQSKESEAREQERQQRALGREAETGYRAPHTRLASYSGQFFKQLNEHSKEQSLSRRLKQQRQRWQSILSPLGYQFNPTTALLESGAELPLLADYRDSDNRPCLWLVEAHDQRDEDSHDPLALSLLPEQLSPVAAEDDEQHKHQQSLLKRKGGEALTWQELIAKQIFSLEEPPRWLLLLGNRQALLIDRTKWAQNRLLRFDFEEILGRKEGGSCQAI
ncbi:hypothetical protein D5085_07490 [Ectothiorhodospiraceae bacterium BW-2]|nr:hypothetical protein D5085_07490 [Ectothiorhodospiraceae bacterium BW-2]